MESTITQNSALYLAHNRGLKPRTGLLYHPRATGKRSRIPDLLRQNIIDNSISILRLLPARLHHRN
jgi:hypothetical protein